MILMELAVENRLTSETRDLRSAPGSSPILDSIEALGPSPSQQIDRNLQSFDAGVPKGEERCKRARHPKVCPRRRSRRRR